MQQCENIGNWIVVLDDDVLIVRHNDKVVYHKNYYPWDNLGDKSRDYVDCCISCRMATCEE